MDEFNRIMNDLTFAVLFGGIKWSFNGALFGCGFYVTKIVYECLAELVRKLRK